MNPQAEVLAQLADAAAQTRSARLESLQALLSESADESETGPDALKCAREGRDRVS